MRDHLDPVLGHELERLFRELDPTDARRSLSTVPPNTPDPRHRAVWVTAIVGVVVVIVAVLAIQSVRVVSRPAVVPTSKAPVVDRSALVHALPTQPYGRVIHTWTEHDATNPTGPFAVTGSTVVIAAVCAGGGAIVITDTKGSRHREGCSRLDVQQPFSRFDLGGDGKSTKETGPVHVRVDVLSGAPQYIVRMWAVDPRILEADTWSIAATSATVPKTLRTCAAGDLDPKGAFDRLAGKQEGVVTIRSRGTTDCAIRSWPVMRYLDRDGGQVGPVAGADNNGKSLDSSEGAVNKYGEFPPARLTAGGAAYLIIDLRTLDQLAKDDARTAAQAKTAPTPSAGPSIPVTYCVPARVAAVRLAIGAATVTVPAPATPTPAACRSSSYVFGVNPVVTSRPTGE